MANVSFKQNDLSKIKWVQIHYMTAPGKCLDILLGLESKDPLIVANKLNLIGIIQFLKYEYFEALAHYKKSIKISKEHGFKEIETKSLINICSTYIILKRYNLALEFGFESLKYKFDRLNSMTYNNLSRIYYHLGNKDRQLKFQNKAKSLNEKAGEKRLVVLDLYNIADFYSNQGKFEQALAALEECLEIIKKHKFNISLAYTHTEISLVCFELEQYEKALYNSDKGFEYSVKFETDELTSASYAKAKVLNHYQQYDEALKLLNSVFENSMNSKKRQDFTYIFELKIEIESKHKPEKLAATYRDYIKLLKSNSTNVDENNELTNILKYKEQEIKVIQKRNEAIEQKNRELEVVSKLLAHDLKTPIRTIGSFVNLIENKLEVENDPEINEYIEFISNGTKEIYEKMNITEKYLNFKLADNRSEFSLNKLLGLLLFDFHSDNQNIKVNVDEDGPTIYGDKIAILRMFEYLLQFIIKHSKKDQVEIIITHKSDGNEDLFFITDNENTMRFARYWFEDISHSELIKTYKIDIKFAFVRKIIKLHNGHILIDEKQNGEPILKIWLPVKVGVD